MSTNYYAVMPDCESACEHCDKTTSVHLGKSSAGWKFLIQAEPDWGYTAVVPKWLDRVAKAIRIEDEYGSVHAKGDFLSWVIGMQNGMSHMKTKESGRYSAVQVWHGFEFLTQEFS